MPGRINPIQEGLRISQRVTADVSDELREARLSHGLTQEQVATALGVGREHVSAVERRVAKAMTIDRVARQAAALGLKVSVKFYPLGDAIRDAAQVRYINHFLSRVGRLWRVALDVPMPIAGDLRAIDVVLTGACTIAVEVVTRLRDVQALIRACQLKQRDFGADRLVIVVAATLTNRRALEVARQSLAAAFELDTQRVMKDLSLGRDPGRDAMVLLRPDRVAKSEPKS